MPHPWPSLLRDPVLRFTLIGAGLFALQAWVAPSSPPVPAVDEARRVVLGAERVQGLADGWRQAWGRPPTPPELEQMVEEEVRGEVLAREAKAQGLDRDDEFIRQHLRERMEVIADHGAVPAEPSEAEIEAFYAANPDKFGGGLRLTLAQLPLDPAQHRDDLASTARQLLERLRQAGPEADLAAFGDLPDLARYFGGVRQDELANLFGEEFLAAVQALPLGEWRGPVASAYGVHLVRVEERAEQPPQPLEEVRDMVREEWSAERLQAQRDRFYAAIREHYEVIVERPPTATRTAAVPVEATAR